MFRGRGVQSVTAEKLVVSMNDAQASARRQTYTLPGKNAYLRPGDCEPSASGQPMSAAVKKHMQLLPHLAPAQNHLRVLKKSDWEQIYLQ